MQVFFGKEALFMTSAGIVAEFNPFHSGHAYIIDEAKRRLGEGTAVVCVMSGSMVQRGEPAAFSKYARAEAAVRCGADLVIELPAPWSLGSAGIFARGAVGLLEASGAVDCLVFGSECGDAALLRRAADALGEPETDAAIGRELRMGVSFAAARQRALESRGIDGRAVSEPNNILGVEYLRALAELGSDMKVITLPRIGAAHDGEGDGNVQSASSLRRRLAAGEGIAPFVPSAAAAVFSRELAAGRGPVTMEKLELPVLARLRALSPEQLRRLPDAAEGLENRLYSAICTEPTVEAILAHTKTKRYALARIRRMLMCAVLGIDAEASCGEAPYIRVLAMSDAGRRLLRRMDGEARLPVVIKPAALRAIGGRAERVFELEAAASDFAALAYASAQDRQPCADWKHTPLVV
jgi:predicted nucleotidyltransferase